MAIRSSGETSARSSTISTIMTTTRTSGMITLLSRIDACSMSALMAEPPPTSASAPGTACTAVRTSSTAANAALDVGSSVSGTEMSATPPFTNGGEAWPRPPMPCSDWVTAAAWSALATICTGVEVSASPWSISTC